MCKIRVKCKTPRKSPPELRPKALSARERRSPPEYGGERLLPDFIFPYRASPGSACCARWRLRAWNVSSLM